MTEGISMREASRVLGVSQIRVRELIRKGTLAAEKVTDAAGERWSIPRSSLDAYAAKRAANPDGQANHTTTPAGGAESASPDRLAQLVGVVERELARVGSLLEEIGKLRSSLDGLKETQTSIVRELERVRQELDKPGEPEPKAKKTEAPKKAQKKQDTPKPQAETAKPEPEPSSSEDVKPDETKPATKKTTAKPKAKAKSAAPAKGKGGGRAKSADTALAAALRDAGVDAADKKPKGGSKKRS